MMCINWSRSRHWSAPAGEFSFLSPASNSSTFSSSLCKTISVTNLHQESLFSQKKSFSVRRVQRLQSLSTSKNVPSLPSENSSAPPSIQLILERSPDLHDDWKPPSISKIWLTLFSSLLLKRKSYPYSKKLFDSSLSAVSTVIRQVFWHQWLLLFLALVIPFVKSEICKSQKIMLSQSTLDEFQILENCTVIEGSLTISSYSEQDPLPSNYSFPKLREITDYLLIYQVSQIETLGILFPNLTVIRGNNLAHNYAFIIFLSQNIYEVGLRSLTHILRGGVRIESNPRLCYVNTINWKAIVNPDYYGVIEIHDNEDSKVCADYCMEDCPVFSPGSKRLCWSSAQNYCQRIIVDCEKDSNCYQDSLGKAGVVERCSEECLGGCSESAQEHCFSCRNYLWKSKDKAHECRKACPPPFLAYMNWRCVSENECKDKYYTVNGDSINMKIPYKIYNQECLKDCPARTRYKVFNDFHTCEECNDDCPKLCSGGVISSLDDIQKYTGCTDINGDLEIRVTGKNIVKELEKSLFYIRNISGSLTISRAFSLISLDFFRNLQEVQGSYTAEYNKPYYSLSIVNNENLQKLFPLPLRIYQVEKGKGKEFKRRQGKIFVHYNPNLCYSEIDNLMSKASLLSADHNERDISVFTNGDKAVCSQYKLQLNVTSVGGINKILFLTFDNYQKIIFEENSTNDIRALLRYEIQYRSIDKATYEHRNLTKYEGHDACGGGPWKITDHSPTPPKYINGTLVFEKENTEITNGKPYTYYAIYVTTLLIRDIATKQGIVGAQSDIVYHLTPNFIPSTPENVRIEKINANSVQFHWKSPLTPNGEIYSYEIRVIRELLDHSRIMERPFCNDEFKVVTVDESSVPLLSPSLPSSSSSSSSGNGTCDCSYSCSSTNGGVKEEDEKLDYHDFHSEIINHIYYSDIDIDDFGDESRDKRSLSEHPWTVLPGNSYEYIYDKLLHYRSYRFEIRACHISSSGMFLSRCSSVVVKNFKALPDPNADDILGSPEVIYQNTSNSDWIRWTPPPDPNELIVNYNIRIISAASDKYGKYCITAKEYIEKGNLYLFPLKTPYYIQVQAVSLYGPGAWSQKSWVTPLIGSSSSSSSSTSFLLLAVLIPILIVFLALSAIGVYRFKNTAHEIVSTNVNYIPTDTVYVADEWEVSRNNVELKGKLGDGAFGMVHRGIFTNEERVSVPCAVKTVKENASYIETRTFLYEATCMKKFHTPHVVKLLGVISDGQPHMVLLEMMERGDLRKYLISRRRENNPNTPPPTVMEILQMAVEITDGMAYIAKQRVVHGDLAARNCMISADLIVKIGDFGLSKDIYTKGYYRKGDKGMMPVRWMSPESLRDGHYSPETDVWSFGIVLWEMLTLGEQPYPGLGNDETLRFIVNQKTMEQPENCPPIIHSLMVDCWQYDPAERPTFIDICLRLLPHANLRFKANSFITSEEGKSAISSQEQERRIASAERANRLKEAEQNHSAVETLLNNSLLSPSENRALSNGLHHSSLVIPPSEFRDFNRLNLGGPQSSSRSNSKWNVIYGLKKMRHKSGSASGEA